MFRKILRSVTMFVALVVAYQAYVLLAVPQMEPVIESAEKRRVTPQEKELGRSAGTYYQLLLANYFPQDHWSQKRPPKVFASSNQQAMLVLDEYTRHAEMRTNSDRYTQVDIARFALLVFPTPPREGITPPRDTIILEAPQGAKLKFDDFRPELGRIGQITGGQFPGRITIRSDMREEGPADDMVIETADLEMNTKLLYSMNPVRFRLGKNIGGGRELEIRFLADEHVQPKSNGLKLAGIDSLEIRRDLKMRLYLETDSLLPGDNTTSGSHAPRGNPLPSRSRGDGASDSATTQSVGIVRSHAERGNEALNDQITALSKQTAIALIDIAEPNSVNLAITSLRASSPFVTTNRETTFDVTLHQFADQPRRQCVIELLVDGERVGEQTVDVAAGSDAVARFTHRFQSPGQHAIEARAANDRLPVDNTRWLVVPVRDEIRVLCIAGRSGAARYIADALNPNPAGDSPIRPVVISEGDLADVDLAGFDCVFACNVAQFTPSEAQRLARYAAAGGGVVFFLGDRVIADNYNTHAQGSKPSPEGTGSLIPAQLGPIISQPSFGLDPLEYRHPIVAPFRGRERAGLLTTPVARYHRLELPRDRADVAVAAAIQNGHPFIVTAPLGRGRTILVATDGSLTSVDATSGEPWTSWPTWPSFLPLIRELLAYATSGQQQEWQQLVGAPLVNDAMSANIKNADSSALRIERPDGQSAPLSINSGTDWSYTDTNLSGIYTLHGLPENATLQFAVNVDTTESDLAKAEPQQLPPELNIGSISNEATGAATGANLSRAGLNESFLWIALAFLFVESFLAWQFGRGVA
jgi:hypothetical protein